MRAFPKYYGVGYTGKLDWRRLEKAMEEWESLWEKNDHVSVLKIQHWRSIGP